MGSMARTWISCASVTVLLLLTIIPSVTGDGMPAYQLVDVNDLDGPSLFTSTFESRQLARVDLLDPTHQRISLFLSVYSMDPGKNLSIMVPLRTLPDDVTGKPMKESEFREDYLLDKIEVEVVEQDPEEAEAKLWEETSMALQSVFGSMLFTLPGEYSRQHYRLTSNGGKDESLGGTDSVGTTVREPAPVQHYEFDGFSIDVFGVDAGGILSSYLAIKGLAIPESSAFDSYMGQYVAVVEAESKPPIDQEDFEFLMTWAPNMTQNLTDHLREKPKLSSDKIWWLKNSFENQIYHEIGWRDPHNIERTLITIMEDLVDAVYGSTDFAGEVMTIDLPLDDGKIFFPLGTSAGWPNEVGDIDVLFKVPEDKDLKIADTKDAFHDGSHWYLFQMELANPGFDLESTVMEGNEDRKVEAARADWTYENSQNLAYLISLIILLVLWFGFAFFLRRGYKIDDRLATNSTLWVMLGLSLLISIPGALLVYFIIFPVPIKKIKKRLGAITPIAMYPAAVAMFVLAVVL
jgi:hypothetical protein